MPGPDGARRLSVVRQKLRITFGSRKQASISGHSHVPTSTGTAVQKAAQEHRQHDVRVFDDEGKDVTPHPLFHPDPKPAASKQSKLLALSDSSRATGSVFLPFSMYQTSEEEGSSAAPHSRTSESSRISKSTMSITESMLDGIAAPGSLQDTAVSSPDVQVRREEIKEQVTEEDLDKRVDIYLTETETLWMLDLPPVVVSVESEDAARVLERNKMYVDVCKNRPGNDRFVEKTMQTINGAAKNKEVQCDKIIMEDKGIVVTTWDLYDSFNTSQVEPTSKAEGSRAQAEKKSTSDMTKDEATPAAAERGSITPTTILESAGLARVHEEEKCHTEATLRSENFQQHLFFMERILMENIFQPKLAAYRQFPVLTDPVVALGAGSTSAAIKEAEQEEHDKEEMDKEEQKEMLSDPSILSELNKTSDEMVPPTLEQLWSYRCDLTHQHNVSSMAWSKVNLDLLAVGYGAFDFKEQKEGLACCWSLKNPMWPERIFHCEHGVTALDFSMAIPNLLAVGMYSGIIVVYNVQSSDSTTEFHSGECSAKHKGPVWQLKWVEWDTGTIGGPKRERLISISADGRITQWLIQEGLGCIDLMKIKRTRSKRKNLPAEKEGKSKALISQWAAGICFDFHPKDTNLYLAGTEEGLIHKCSRSCNKQFLKTYRGHKGPVYKVAWNPFTTDTFLSCSVDWSVILWHQNSQTPILTFSSTTTVVHDIMWSPKSAFTFAAASESRVEIWDLSTSILDPVITRSADPEAKFTSVLFAKNTDCLLVGDSRGEVSVFELQDLAASSSAEVDALSDVIGPALFPVAK
ncbi:dynein axonemal intermediate chain 4 isoform X2 [Tympanuchus pallidicinctus]|uniref:dynein axonemal intermediate chain 4 isoform X2 n=2 Tax=Tympanuchus pallidicinctus TaxID=109042 RepID=UPI0022876D82|nr:dynein axonemal intermediate chain 4 isoform X2 [Tympanuchus pallidicinctus]